MSTTNDTTVNAKLNTIQPIEGAKDVAANTSRTINPIDGTNGRFEWYQYNDDLRIIHCRDDDTFHAGSIVKALGSTKLPKDWLRNKQTIELLEGFMKLGEFSHVLLTTQKTKFNDIKIIEGTYIHRLLVNHFAMWISPKYAYKISVLLDDHFELKRRIEENRALEDKNKTLIQKVDELLDNNRTLIAKNDELLSKNDELLQINRDQTDTLNKMRRDMKSIKASAESIAPIASSLKNRVSSPLSEEYLLVRYSNDNGSTVDVYYKAVNPNTIKKEKIDISSYWIHQSFANSVDAQNRLLDLLQSNGMLIKLDRRAKSFKIRSYHLNKLRTIIENDLNGALNVESSEISTEATDIRDKSTVNQSAELFNGYPLDYCTEVCNRWKIDMNILSTIIERKSRYGKYPVRLHPTDGLCYRRSVNGKTIYYKLPYDAFE